jgi:hypothetical protein
MMSASIDTKVHLLREETAASPLESALRAKIGQLLRVISEQLGCKHPHFVFDEIGDVYCQHCRQDLTD